jgi:hypothetical protein
MPIRAIAYHPAIVTKKLRTYFLTAMDEVSVGEGIRCPKCGLTFAVVFPIRDDLGNDAYRKRLKVLVVDDCKEGKHNDEYVIDDMR